MRLAIVISLCVLIVVFSIGSLLVYGNWRKDRYDPLIVDAANRHDLPPSLVKAIIDARGRFNYDSRGERGEVGLMQVPQEGVAQYRTMVMKNPEYDFGWVCVNKAHPPHDETIRHNLSGTCNICRTPLIRGESYPKQNIEMGAWYLARLKAEIEKATQRKGDDVIRFVVAAYCLTEKTARKVTDNYRNPVFPPLIKEVLDAYQRYKRKGLR